MQVVRPSPVVESPALFSLSLSFSLLSLQVFLLREATLC